MIRQLRAYARQVAGDIAETWRELREERNWLGLGVLVLLVPFIVISAVLAALGDIGPE